VDRWAGVLSPVLAFLLAIAVAIVIGALLDAGMLDRDNRSSPRSLPAGSHHSPLREALVGGVSRELLEHMTVPVLMSH
jgi:nucleotide-binding universal stress UspA family protein